jgi:hypothetical protein
MHFPQRLKLLTICSSIALVIWLGFAYVEHQYDFNHHDHSEHYCHQYASIQHGLKTLAPFPALAPIVKREALLESHYTLSKQVSVYKARSPPSSSLLLTQSITI